MTASTSFGIEVPAILIFKTGKLFTEFWCKKTELIFHAFCNVAETQFSKITILENLQGSFLIYNLFWAGSVTDFAPFEWKLCKYELVLSSAATICKN